MQREDTVMMEAEAGVMQPQALGHLDPPGAARDRKVLPSAPEGVQTY